MSGHRVLVTGASGFVGRWTLAPLLARGDEVHALHRPGRAAPARAGVHWHALDLMAPDGLARLRELLQALRPSHLLHCAWYVEHGRFWDAPQNLAWEALGAEIAREALATGVQRLLGVGSCAEYDWQHRPGTPRREDDPLAPATLYGQCKARAAEAWLGLARQAGASAAWARLFHLYGPGEPAGRLVPATIDALLAGQPALLGPGHYTRDFLATQDAGAALAAVLHAPGLQGPVNLAGGHPLRVDELAAMLGTLASRRGLLRPGALPARGNDVPAMLADVSLLRRHTGWQPGLTLERGLGLCLADRMRPRPLV